MSKGKYAFNPKTLEYEPKSGSLKRKLSNLLFYFSAFCISLIIGYIVFSLVYDTPRERELKRENSQLNDQLVTMEDRLNEINPKVESIIQRDRKIASAMYGAQPLSERKRQTIQDSVFIKEYEHLTVDQIVQKNAERLYNMKEMISFQIPMYDETMKVFLTDDEFVKHVPSIQPINNKDLTRVAAGFGKRSRPFYNNIRKHHDGMDFTAPLKTEVRATGSARVEKVIRSSRGMGNKVVLNHSYGYKTIYAHLDGFEVYRGKKVKRGDVIGYVGNTGQSAGPHLHYEVIFKGEKVDPVNYFFHELNQETYLSFIDITASIEKSFD